MSASDPAGPRVVALGGGHGLAATLAALRRVTAAVTAVVTVADDGGSSGRIRAELGCVPPGDLRMALAALAGTDAWSRTWSELLQHRFPGDGGLGGHAVGNLLLAGLAESTGSTVEALALVGRLVGARGRVLPMCESALDIVAIVAGLDPTGALTPVHGQHAVATTTGRVSAVHLVPPEPTACPAAVAAVEEADWVVLGPGSLFSSVLPHLLVPALRDALLGTSARRVFVLNLAPQPGETAGFSPEAHLHALEAHAPGLKLDVVLADPAVLADGAPAGVLDTRGLMGAAESFGARLHLSAVGEPGGLPRHDPDRLASAFREVFA